MTAGPNARAVLFVSVLTRHKVNTYLIAPPVYATDIIMTTNKMRPNPRGARGVNRFFSDTVSGS